LPTKIDIASKQESKKPQQINGSVKIDLGECKQQSCRQKMAGFLMSKCMDWFFIAWIIVYMLLVFVTIIFDNGCVTEQATLDALQALRYVELAILILFLLEIFIKTWALGFKVSFFLRGSHS